MENGEASNKKYDIFKKWNRWIKICIFKGKFGFGSEWKCGFWGNKPGNQVNRNGNFFKKIGEGMNKTDYFLQKIGVVRYQLEDVLYKKRIW